MLLDFFGLGRHLVIDAVVSTVNQNTIVSKTSTIPGYVAKLAGDKKFKADEKSPERVSSKHGGDHVFVPFIAMEDGGTLGAHALALLKMLVAEYVTVGPHRHSSRLLQYPRPTTHYTYILPTIHYLLPTTYYLLPTTYYLQYYCTYYLRVLPTPYSLLPTPYSLLPTTYYLLPTTYYLLPTTYYLLPTTYYLLPTTYYLLPTTYYLLPTTYYQLPATSYQLLVPTTYSSLLPTAYTRTAYSTAYCLPGTRNTL